MLFDSINIHSKQFALSDFQAIARSLSDINGKILNTFIIDF